MELRDVTQFSKESSKTGRYPWYDSRWRWNMKPIVFAIALLLTAAAAAAIPPPVYDFCPLVVPAGALPNESYSGTNCDGDNLVVDHDCDTWTQTHGSEDYYEIDMGPGCWFEASVAHDGDAMLMVTAECIVYGTMFTCLASADDGGPGSVEHLFYQNEAAANVTVYLVIDSAQTADCGTYILDLVSDCPIDTDAPTWSELKSDYR